MRNATKRGCKMNRTWLTEYRGERTHQQVADLANIDRSYYTQLESGIRNPSVETAKKVASALGFNWTLFFESDCVETNQTKGGIY
nr:helix-turn-helix transcriptional regulator [Heliophilum fasciatum]